MNYNLMPSLEHIALVKITSTLWSGDDARAMAIQYVENSCLNYQWSEVEFKVMEKVSQLSMPGGLEKKIITYITYIGNLIRNWVEMMHSIPFREGRTLHVILPNSFCWTPQGMIDQKKMAEILVKDERLSIFLRCELACIFCLEAEILILRYEISKYCGKDFNTNRKHILFQYFEYEFYIVWHFDLKERAVNSGYFCWPSHYLDAFRSAAFYCNKVATEYLLRKLPPEKREESLMTVACGLIDLICDDSDSHQFHSPFRREVFCFLLTQMNEEQQMEVFRLKPHALTCFLEWPWQSFFLETAYRHVSQMSGDGFMPILQAIICRMDSADYNYQVLFREFWRMSSKYNCCSYVLDNEDHFGCLVEELIFKKDRKNVELILKYATPVQKKKYSPKSTFITRLLEKVYDWDVLEFFVQEFISSKDLVIEFLEVLSKCSVKESFEERNDALTLPKLLQLLNDLMHEVDRRRNLEDVNNSPDECSNSVEA